jgi:nitroreductase
MFEKRPFHDVVRERRSIRSFLPQPVPDAIIRAVTEDARHAPSNANIQPAVAHIASGAARDALSQAILAADEAGRQTPDFPWSYDDFYGVYAARQKSQGATYFKAMGIARDSTDSRAQSMRRNLEFFGAPHVCLLFMPAFYDGVRVASDVGMYAQTFLLSLAAHGLAGVPQTYLGFYAETVREELKIDSSLKMLFGISFGYPDMESPASSFQMEKASIEENVTFHI